MIFIRKLWGPIWGLNENYWFLVLFDRVFGMCWNLPVNLILGERSQREKYSLSIFNISHWGKQICSYTIYDLNTGTTISIKNIFLGFFQFSISFYLCQFRPENFIVEEGNQRNKWCLSNFIINHPADQIDSCAVYRGYWGPNWPLVKNSSYFDITCQYFWLGQKYCLIFILWEGWQRWKNILNWISI